MAGFWIYTAPDRPISAAAVERLSAAHPDLVLLDVRTPEEYAAGRIASQAVNCHVSEIELCAERIPLPTGAPIVVYCTSGVRSFAALRRLRALGFREVYDFAGGTDAWTRSGRALVTE